MRNDPIRIADIQRRQQRAKSAGSNDNRAAITEAAIEVCKNKSNKQFLVERLFDLCSNTENAEKCMPYLVNFINESDGVYHKSLVSGFVGNIAPMIENTDMVLGEISRIEDDSARKVLENAIYDNITIDKILENHNKISKRFNINSYVLEHNCVSIADPVDVSVQICEWIDTYQMPAYAKLQTAIEETYYLFQKNGVDYNRSDVLKNIVEYFLISDSINKNDAKRVLEQSKVITTEDTSMVGYIFNEYASDDISAVIEKCKADDKLNETKFNRVMNSLYAKSPEQLVDGTPNILAWIRQIIVYSTLGANLVVGAVVILVDKLIKMNINRKQTKKVYNALKSEKKKTQKAIRNASGAKKDRLEKYNDCLDNSINDVEMYMNDLYTSDELSKQREIENEAAKNYPYTLEEFSNFKFSSIMDVAKDAANYIKSAYDKMLNKSGISVKSTIKKAPDNDVDKDGNRKKKGLSRISDTLSAGLKSIASHLTEADSNTGLFDTVVITFDVSESKAEDVYNIASSICEDANNRYSKSGAKFYSNTVGNICEIHMINMDPILLKESEKECIGDAFTESDIHTISEMLYLSRLYEMYTSYKPDEILTDLLSSDLGFEEAYCIMDLQKYSGVNESDEVWDKLKDKYMNRKYDSNDYTKINENTLLNELSYEFGGSDIPFNIQVEACGIMRRILNEGFDTSSIKVAIQGMKNKVKNLGVKEKEISRDMDVAANGFMRSIENAMTNDRREAIIKGSIIPSFSKCIKIAIGACTVGFLFDPVVAIIGLMGGLAGSKYLNNRERMLLLDEIEVELKVVEKELQRAENEDDMTKYRKLLTYQKRLKKEDFKLRYNISRKMGKDYITRSGKEED